MTLKFKIIVSVTFSAFAILFLLVVLLVPKDSNETTTVDLEPGQKLEGVVWREDTAWYLTRLMKDGEEPEVHYFSNYLNSEREPIVIIEHSFE